MKDTEAIQELVKKNQKLKTEVQRIIIGQEDVIDKLLISIFSGGHSLLIGVPGLAKTLMINTLSKALGLEFSRIQFTPDLMPSDIVGAEILDEKRDFKFIKGPVFGNLILADEINRTPPKTQSALLEAMQEKSVTVAGKTYPLASPYFVLATQNPIEQEGTYPLPEAQLDRFMFSINLTYPSKQEEVDVVKSTTIDNNVEIEPLFTSESILFYQSLIKKIPVPDNVLNYAVDLVRKTRPDTPETSNIVKEFVDWGAGPRASQNLIFTAKTHAALNGKYSPDIEDIQAIALSVLRHRVLKNYNAEAEGYSIDDILKKLL